ncbi:MAG: FG-GAP repeat domain-containing protein, partial [Phycisphaerae bacterium]
MSRSIWVCARILFTLHVCAAGSYGQCPNDGVDCNKNKMSDACEIEKRLSLDCNANGVPDECDVTDGGMLDCNANLVPDACEIRAATPLIRESFAAESINTSTWPIVADMTIDTDFPRAIGYSARFDSASSQLVSRQIDLEGALWANLDFLIYGQQPVLVFFRTQDQWTHVPAQPLFVSEGHRYDISIPMQFHATTAQVRIRPANVNNFMPFMIDEITLTRYEPDCNENSVIDRCDAELVEDCNNNDVPDTCDLESPRWERHWHPGIWKSHTHLAAADLNLDGHMDLVTSNVIPSRNVSIWWNEGDNQFTEMVVTETASGSTVGSSRFIIANVTNDPFPDIVSSSDG